MTFIERPHENEKNRALSYVAKLLSDARNSKDERTEDIKELEDIQKLLSTKKYGLVWEEHAEKFEEDMKTVIPIFYEDSVRKINDNIDSEDFNFLLEGDNLHSLHLLEKTHKNTIDLIYIDPPYNTGAKDWRYNNDYVDGNDAYRHSKWLSFMEKRLRIARSLLKSQTGVLIIAIDDYEIANTLGLLENLFTGYEINTVIVKHHPQGGASNNISRIHEYAIFVIPKYKKIIKGNKQLKIEESWSLMRGGRDRRNLRIGRPNSFYAIYVDSKTLVVKGVGDRLTADEQYKLDAPKGCFALYPLGQRGEERVWRYERSTMIDLIQNNKIICTPKHSLKVIKNRDVKHDPVFSIWEDSKYNAGTFGTDYLTNVLEIPESFTYPKSIHTVKDAIKFSTMDTNNAIVLDFFAGSGTTGQAVIELNEEDGGNRKFILATNNENKIAEEVTYERMKRVSSGTEKYKAHPMNLKYFKTDFIDKQVDDLEKSLLANVKTLIELKHGIDLNDSDVAIVTKRSNIKELDIPSLSTIYMRSQTHKMLDRQQLEDLTEIKIIDIPETFFPLEMKEAGL